MSLDKLSDVSAEEVFLDKRIESWRDSVAGAACEKRASIARTRELWR